MAILDSGERTEYTTGAVRDIKEGKGRFDLIPMNILRCFSFSNVVIGELLNYINGFMVSGSTTYLYECINKFVDTFYPCRETAYLALAIHFEEGAKKYGEWNWKKGIPLHSFLDSAIRHLMKYSRGDSDEPHDRAFIWNLLCLIYTKDAIDYEMLPRELDDLNYDKYLYDLRYEELKMKEYQEQAEDLETFKDILDKSSDKYEQCFG